MIVVAGTEHFVGCLDISHEGKCTHADPTGSLALTYILRGTVQLPDQPDLGGCQHGIVPGMGTGGLAGAAGWLDFTDNVTNGTAAYDGYFTLGGRRRGAHVATAAAAVARPRLPGVICSAAARIAHLPPCDDERAGRLFLP